jgi:peptidoglycan/xylan/chitin deacetylase (PgdA/CDA1 family)
MYQAIDLAFVQGAMLNDWENGTSVQQRVNNALNAARDGQIIMLHDFEGNYQTVQALSQIIEGLKNQGYQFVTLSELFQYKGKNANQEYKIWSNVFN